MKIRRSDNGMELLIQTGASWRAVKDRDRREHPALFAMLEANAPEQPVRGARALPFRPRSYRDFMLYERHFVQAGRGYLRRFRPKVAGMARAYERVFRGTFPPLRPKPLWYREPIYYMGNHLRFVGSGAQIPWPSYTQALDYELELGFVLASPLLNATPSEACAAIGGFVVINDISARDIQTAEMASGFGPQKSKHFVNVMSDVLVTSDEILPVIDRLVGSISINGSVVARCSSAGMRFTLGEALAHVSQAEQLVPGELFATGTWPDGSGMETGNWLACGDEIRLEIEGVGYLNNRVETRHDEQGVPS